VDGVSRRRDGTVGAHEPERGGERPGTGEPAGTPARVRAIRALQRMGTAGRRLRAERRAITGTQDAD
jgi:hypothetical protein